MTSDIYDELEKSRALMRRYADVYKEMGHLISEWAMLELQINECIWKIADVAPTVGACLTSQIIPINGRLMALISLMDLRGFSEELIKQVNRFSSDMRAPGEKRNRTVHDPVIVHLKDEVIARLEVTAQRKPIFETKLISVEAIQSDRREILECHKKFLKIREAIFAALPTLPEIPKREFPIDLNVVLPV